MQTGSILVLAAAMLLALAGCCCPQKACCDGSARCAPTAKALPEGPYAKDRKQSAWAYLAGKYDANGDGKISAQEHGRGERAFKNLDRNGDGSITPDELGPGPIHGLMVRMLAMLWFQDDDKPMVLSRDEFARGFEAVDTNENSTITSKELAERMRTTKPHVTTIPPPPPGMDPFLSLKLLADKDGDGALSKAEALALFDAHAEDGTWSLRPPGGKRPPPGAKRRPQGAVVGERAPDFTLTTPDGGTSVTLSSFRGRRPVALIFGSYT